MKALGLDLYPWALEKLRPSAVPVQTGVESPNFLAARRVTLPVESFQSEVADDAPADVAVKRLVERGPDMFMDQMGERGTRNRALEDSVQQAEQSGLSADGACRLRDILSRRVDAFRRALRGDPPARVEPMRVHLKPQAQAVKARPRRYDPVNRAVSVVHRGFGGVWFARAVHPGLMGQSSHGGAKKRHFPFGQRLPGGELAGGADSEGDD